MGLKFLEKNCKDIGIVEAIGDGIGLTNVANGEMIQEEVLSSDDVIRKFQLMSLPPIHTSAFIIGDYKTAIAGNWIQYVPKTWHILKKPLKTVMEVSTMNKNWNPNFDNLYISKLCTSKYFDDVIKSQQLFEKFFKQTSNLTPAEKRYCMTHFNQTYSTFSTLLKTHYGYILPVGETKEHNLVLYGILSSWENKKSWNAFNPIVPPSEQIAEGVPTKSGKSYLTQSVFIKLDKTYNPEEVFPTITETEERMKGFEQVNKTTVVDYFLRSIKEEYPCLELDTYVYKMMQMSKVFEMFHQGKKVEAINKYMLENNEELIAQNREIIKNMQIQDE